MVALCAMLSSTAMLLFAGIAAACSGGGGPECGGKPVVTTSSTGSISPTGAYVYGYVDPNECQTTYVFEYRKSGGGAWGQGGNYETFGSGKQLVSDFLTPLTPATSYEYKLTATNIKGSTSGEAKSFKTPPEEGKPSPPSVTTEAASGITSTGATLNGSVNPNGSSTTYKFEYGTKEKELNKATAPLSAPTSQKYKAEVNLEPETKYYFRIWASNAGGTTKGSELNFTTSAGLWSIKESPNPGASGNYLFDVSCEPSTSVCTSVGKGTSSGVDSPVALRWNGSAWSEQTAAKKSGSTHNRLFGVDCPSETRCIAVGNYQNSEGGPATLGELWNESKWSVQSTPVPAEATSSELVAVGCNSTASCRAAGSA
ncbi:MAG TPA: fibronectin type III domain-containing protein, partial [Solirubrobacterales bacterium]|nr:fibronectin type III domain-containing protein [Solirubrobacterales bacterium]